MARCETSTGFRGFFHRRIYLVVREQRAVYNPRLEVIIHVYRYLFGFPDVIYTYLLFDPVCRIEFFSAFEAGCDNPSLLVLSSELTSTPIGPCYHWRQDSEACPYTRLSCFQDTIGASRSLL